MYNSAVIGASGFLGKAIVHKLAAAGHAVFAVSRNPQAIQPAGCAAMSLGEFLSSGQKYDFIFFAAGSFSSSHQELVDLNCTLLRQITGKFAASRMIYISSTNVYGFHEQRIHEASAFNQPTLYGLSKLAGEFVATAADSYAILRLTYLYGKGLNNRSFLPNLISQAQELKKITLFGEGKRAQDYLHVEDAADLCMKAMHLQNGVYLGATGTSYSNLQVAQAVARHVENCTIEFTGTETGHSFYFDPVLTNRTSGWTASKEFETGIKEMLV